MAKKRSVSSAGLSTAEALRAPSPPAAIRQVGLGYLLFTVLAVGCGVLMLEILGARIAGPVFGVSLYIWTALIAVTLCSLSAGYWLGGVFCDRLPSPDRMYGLILAAGIWIAFLPWLDGPVLSACYTAFGGAWGIRLGALAAAFVLFAPPLTLLGMVSPFAIKLALASLEGAGRTAGGLYAVSTLGSVAGAILAGYALIPGIGVAGTLFVITCVVVAPAALWFLAVRRLGALAVGAMMLFLGAATAWTRPGLKPLPSDVTILENRDSPYGQVKVMDRGSWGRTIRWLLIEGTAQTGVYLDADGKPGESIVSNYAIVIDDFVRLHPPAGRKALLLGLGGGALVQPLARTGYEVNVAEIDPVVVDFARRYFSCDPETARVHIEDARAFLRRTAEQFDLIVFDVFSGGSQPFHFFSREAFEEAAEKLAPGGLIALNAIAFPEGPHSMLAKSLYRTASQVFPHRAVYIGYPEDPLDDLNNILMFFSAEPFSQAPESDRDANAPQRVDYLEARKIEMDPEAGKLVTDDWNPVDRWSQAVNEAWRARVFESMGAEILTY